MACIFSRTKKRTKLLALGIGGERRKELCAVERSTEANAEPRKARPRLSREGKGGNAQKQNIFIIIRNITQYKLKNLRIIFFHLKNRFSNFKLLPYKKTVWASYSS